MRLASCILVLFELVSVAPVALPANPVHAAAPVRITLDPGHGGSQIGAAYTFDDGVLLQEKTLNLRVALILRDLLRQAGFAVDLTRATDAAVNTRLQDLNGDGRVSLADELQARVDTANAAGSDLFVSICFNGSSDASALGTETFWNSKRTFAAENQQLAENVQKSMVAALTAAGYQPRDRGAHTDSSLLNGDSFFLLGPNSSTIARPSRMPGIIAEPLFLTNAADATALRDDKILSAVARGFFDGIKAYVGRTRAAVSVARPPTPTARPAGAPASGWTVWAETYTDSPKGRRLAGRVVQALAARGLPASVLTTADLASLHAGFVVVTSGVFPTRQAALERVAQLRRAGYPNAYVRTVPR